MNRQALVGLFTVIALLGLFAIFFVLENLGTQGRYQIGVHFKSAAGLHRGALVYESGVVVGIVQQTILLPKDFTVDVILGINDNVDVPRDARFTVIQPLTGDTTLEIVPPAASGLVGVVGATPSAASVAILPRQVLPVDQQPQGINPPSITDLLEQGQNEVLRLDHMLALLERSEPQLLGTLQSTLDNFNTLANSGGKRLFEVTDRVNALIATMQVAVDAGGRNLVDLTGQLDSTVRRNSGHVDRMVGDLSRLTRSLAVTVDQVRDLATNPQLKHNLLDVTAGLAKTSTEIAGITSDVRTITSDPQTQADLKNTVASLDASTQKLNSLLGSLGGQSSVYGVDAGATPVPSATGNPAAGAAPAPVITGAPSGASRPILAAPALRSRLRGIASNLLAIQFRVAELDYPPAHTVAAPYVPVSRGPQADANLIFLPKAATSLLLGANDLGTSAASYNVAELKHLNRSLTLGGGVLYSNVGGLVQWQPSWLGVEARAYDLRHPTVDVYGNVRLNPDLTVFGGERDVTEGARRSAIGLQLQF